MADLDGINLAMQTPFRDNGDIDFDRLAELVDLYIDCGVHGLVFSSGTGQHAYLTETECNELFRAGIRQVDKRVTVTCQTSALNLDEVRRRSRSAEDLGADAVMVLPPYLEGPTHDDGILSFYQAVSEALTTADIVGYNIPAATGIELSPALFTRLCELPRFAYIKDSSGDLCKQQALLATGGKVLNGADPLAPYSFMAGTCGTIWGGANFMPREAVRLYEHVRAGEYDAALELWTRMFPSIEYIWHNDYIPAVKAACRIMGFGGGPVRPPVCEIGPAAEQRLRAALAPLEQARS